MKMNIESLLQSLPLEERDAARELLSKLDLPAEKKVYHERAKTVKLPPYILQTENICNLCQATSVSIFHMKETVQGGLISAPLKNIPSDLNELEIRRESRRSLVCKACPAELEKWSKQELIKELIKCKSLLQPW